MWDTSKKYEYRSYLVFVNDETMMILMYSYIYV